MPLKSLMRQLTGGIGSISRRNFSHHNRVRSQSVGLDRCHNALDNSQQQSCWADLPPELLRDVLQRVNSSESSWPARKHVVACAAVCRTWRDIIKELVKTPEECEKITFPVSLKQPGPRDTIVQCLIKRDRATSTYNLYLGLAPTLLVENGKFLLAARKSRRAASTDYIISLNTNDMSKGSNTYLGKLRSNFLGTKFTIYDSQPLHGAVAQNTRLGRHLSSKQVSPMVPSGRYNIAHIAYELNVLGTRGPRRMQCTLHTIPSAAMEVGGKTSGFTEFSSFDDSSSSFFISNSMGAISDCNIREPERTISRTSGTFGPLILKNKSPRWHEQLQCWCLNFRGRVTVASVKNFQLVAAIQPGQGMPQSEYDKVLLQFGKIGKDIFTMDYRYPLSAFQAFAICLSSFDTKLACE